MKLHASHIECAVTECHDVSFFTYGGYFQAIREIFPVDYPGMVSSYLYGRGKSFEQIVLLSQTDGTLYAVEHLIQVGQFSSVHFADGLLAQADPNIGFFPAYLRMTSSSRPASSGTPGPGDSRILSNSSSSSSRNWSLRFTVTSAPNSLSHDSGCTQMSRSYR